MPLPLLGTRSWFSLMDGARSPSDLVDAASALGWSALALADANNFHALPELVDAAAGKGIKALAAASIFALSFAGTNTTAILIVPPCRLRRPRPNSRGRRCLPPGSRTHILLTSARPSRDSDGHQGVARARAAINRGRPT